MSDAIILIRLTAQLRAQLQAGREQKHAHRHGKQSAAKAPGEKMLKRTSWLLRDVCCSFGRNGPCWSGPGRPVRNTINQAISQAIVLSSTHSISAYIYIYICLLPPPPKAHKFHDFRHNLARYCSASTLCRHQAARTHTRQQDHRNLRLLPWYWHFPVTATCEDV